MRVNDQLFHIVGFIHLCAYGMLGYFSVNEFFANGDPGASMAMEHRTSVPLNRIITVITVASSVAYAAYWLMLGWNLAAERCCSKRTINPAFVWWWCVYVSANAMIIFLVSMSQEAVEMFVATYHSVTREFAGYSVSGTRFVINFILFALQPYILWNLTRNKPDGVSVSGGVGQ